MPERPTDNLFRGFAAPAACQLVEAPEARAADAGDDEPAVLRGYFTPFNDWTEINSWFEGHFMERIAMGAFRNTIAQRLQQVRVQFDHGYDSFVGSSPLGPIRTLREETFGPYYEVPLLDTDYNRDRILPMARGTTMGGADTGSLLGASFRFRVIREDWNDEPGASPDNPQGLPERTITEVRLYEFGPVVFPAYPNATASVEPRSTSEIGAVRSLTDHYVERLHNLRTGQPFGAGEPATPNNRYRNEQTDDAPAILPPVEEPSRMSVAFARALLDTVR